MLARNIRCPQAGQRRWPIGGFLGMKRRANGIVAKPIASPFPINNDGRPDARRPDKFLCALRNGQWAASLWFSPHVRNGRRYPARAARSARYRILSPRRDTACRPRGPHRTSSLGTGPGGRYFVAVRPLFLISQCADAESNSFVPESRGATASARYGSNLRASSRHASRCASGHPRRAEDERLASQFYRR